MRVSKRFEYKYLISKKDYYLMKSLIAALMTHDQHQNTETYPVNSIYLDDLVYSGASDKAFGNEMHKKYRIRYYYDDTEMKLELKEKIGEVSTKYATAINSEVYQAIIDGHMGKLESYMNDPLIRRFVLDFNRNYYQPICEIRYHREAYKDTFDNCRITFDHSLYSDYYDSQNKEGNIPLISSNMMVLEVKYEHFVPKEIQTILNRFSLQQIAYSKYFLGYMSLYT